MKNLVKFWQAESAMIVSILVALAGAVTLPGSWEKVLGVILPLLGGGAVRQTVWAPDTHEAAVQAAVAATYTGPLTNAPAPPPAVTGGGVTGVAPADLIGQPTDPPT